MSRSPLHILHVEDDAADRDLVRLAIRKSPASTRIVGAADGEEAFELLRTAADSDASQLPELILLDLNLPKKDGRQLLFELKQHPRLKLIPVIVLTTSEALGDVETCYRHGAACYLIKPIDFDALVALARKLVEFWLLVKLVPHTEDL